MNMFGRNLNELKVSNQTGSKIKSAEKALSQAQNEYGKLLREPDPDPELTPIEDGKGASVAPKTDKTGKTTETPAPVTRFSTTEPAIIPATFNSCVDVAKAVINSERRCWYV